MKNYKVLKSSGKTSVRKVDVNGEEVLECVSKRYDGGTGEPMDDIVKTVSLQDCAYEIQRCKDQVTKIQAEQSDWEELEKDLKAL